MILAATMLSHSHMSEVLEYSHKEYGPRQANLVLICEQRSQASLRIRAVSLEPPLLAHTSSESRGTFRQKPRSLAPLNGWACVVKICHEGMLEDTNSLHASHIWATSWENLFVPWYVNNKDTDQPMHLLSRIGVFIVHCLDSIISLVSISKMSSL